jgi:hypothetical protein
MGRFQRKQRQEVAGARQRESTRAFGQTPSPDLKLPVFDAGFLEYDLVAPDAGVFFFLFCGQRREVSPAKTFAGDST